MKRVLIISLIILVGLVGFRLFKILSATQNFEIIPSKEIFKADPSFSWPKLSLGSDVETKLGQTLLREEKEGQINILILGEGGKNHPGGHLTDTILVGSISLKDPKKAILFSIPRDLYVRIPEFHIWTKINAIKAYGGLDSLKSVIKDLMELTIHYNISLDFEEFIKIIDALGGVTVYVEEDIYDPLFPGSSYTYEPFELSKGWHYLDGITTLKYIRTRYGSGGDFNRTKRQQQILEALRIKLNSPKSFLSFGLVTTILSTLGSGFETDIEFSQIPQFYALASGVWPRLIDNKIIDISESGLLSSQHHPTAGSILIPKAGIGNYREIREWVEEMIE